jgi:hypothetical protein
MPKYTPEQQARIEAANAKIREKETRKRGLRKRGLRKRELLYLGSLEAHVVANEHRRVVVAGVENGARAEILTFGAQVLEGVVEGAGAGALEFHFIRMDNSRALAVSRGSEVVFVHFEGPLVMCARPRCANSSVAAGRICELWRNKRPISNSSFRRNSFGVWHFWVSHAPWRTPMKTFGASRAIKRSTSMKPGKPFATLRNAKAFQSSWSTTSTRWL